MMRMVETRKLDGLLEGYTWAKLKKPVLRFGEYAEGLVDEDGEPLVKLVDSVGVVMRADFESAFPKDAIDLHFDALAEAWFKGVNSQVDFGAVLAFVKELFQEETSKPTGGKQA